MSQLLCLALALLLSGTSPEARSVGETVPISEPELDTISIYIKKTLENLREVMPRGIPELNIAPLDPFKMPVVDIPRIKDGVADIHLGLRDVVLGGLSNFAVRHAKGNLEKMGIELHMFFPEAAARSSYNLDGKVLIFPLFGKGPAAIQINDLSIKFAASVSIQDMRKVQLDSLQVDLTFSQMQTYLEGIIGGGSLGSVVNTLLNAMGKLIYDRLKDRLLPEISRILRTVINSELAKVDLQAIIGGMLPHPTSFSLTPVDESANNYVDRLMENLRPHLRNNNLDPVRIPDQSVGFSKFIWPIHVHGKARMWNGQVHGLSTIHRAGNCHIGAEGTRVTVGCEIGINNPRGGFDGRAEFMGIGVNVRINLNVGHVRVGIRVKADLMPGSKPNLEDFAIRDVGHVGISVHGLGPLDWILTPVANVVVNVFKNCVVRAIEHPVREELKKVVASIDIPNFA